MRNEIVIIARPQAEQGPSGRPNWQLEINRYTGGQGSGGSVENITSRQELQQELAKFTPQDRVIIKVPGLATIVFDGGKGNDFYYHTFRYMTNFLISVSDGSINSILHKLPSTTRALIEDLRDDLTSAGSNGRFIRFTAIDNANAAATSEGVSPPAAGAQAFYIPMVKNDTSNADGNGATSQYHQIYLVIPNIFGHSIVNLANSASKAFDIFGMVMLHELIHVVEGEASVTAEYTKFGLTDDNHRAFDLAVREVWSFTNRLNDGYNFQSTNQSLESIKGTANTDFISRTATNIALVDALDGADTINIPLGYTTVNTGLGDDYLGLSAGSGRLIWSDDGGNDILSLNMVSSISQISTERVGEWLYLGINVAGTANKSATELSDGILFKISEAPEIVRVGSINYTISQLLSVSNSKPDFVTIGDLKISAPFSGGVVTDLITIDPYGGLC